MHIRKSKVCDCGNRAESRNAFQEPVCNRCASIEAELDSYHPPDNDRVKAVHPGDMAHNIGGLGIHDAPSRLVHDKGLEADAPEEINPAFEGLEFPRPRG